MNVRHALTLVDPEDGPYALQLQINRLSLSMYRRCIDAIDDDWDGNSPFSASVTFTLRNPPWKKTSKPGAWPLFAAANRAVERLHRDGLCALHRDAAPAEHAPALAKRLRASRQTITIELGTARG